MRPPGVSANAEPGLPPTLARPPKEKTDELGLYPLPAGASFDFSFHSPPYPSASELMAPSSRLLTSVATCSTSRSRLSAWRRVDASWEARGPKTQSSLMRRLRARRSLSAVFCGPVSQAGHGFSFAAGGGGGDKTVNWAGRNLPGPRIQAASRDVRRPWRPGLGPSPRCPPVPSQSGRGCGSG